MRKVLFLMCLAWGISLLWAQPSAHLDIYAPEIITQLSTPLEDFSAQATAMYQEADYEKAASLYLKHLAARPGDASALYNLACCYGLLGKETHASSILQLAYKAGFEDINHISGDPDFTSVRDSQDFIATMDSLLVWAARKAETAGELRYYRINTYLPYRIYYPANYSPEMECTLLVGLHGYGDEATAFGGISRILRDKPIIFLVPEAPYGMDMGTSFGYSWTPSLSFEDPMQESSFMGLKDAIVDLTRDIQKLHKLSNTILFGFSQGCFMTYNIGLAHPETFNALMAFGGWLMPEIVGEATIDKASNLKVYISHGTQDNIVSYSSGEEAHNYLISKKFDVQMDSFEGAHRIDKTSFHSGLDWLMRQ